MQRINSSVTSVAGIMCFLLSCWIITKSTPLRHMSL